MDEIGGVERARTSRNSMALKYVAHSGHPSIQFGIDGCLYKFIPFC